MPDQIPLEQAAILTDAVATPYAGLIDRAARRPVGAAPIIALDPPKAARRRALDFGADFALDPTAAGVEREVWHLTDGVGLAVAVNLMGANRILAQGNACLGRSGRLVMIGYSMEPVALGDLEEKSINAVVTSRPNLDVDPEAAKAVVRSGI